jgi:hypothetical protein
MRVVEQQSSQEGCYTHSALTEPSTRGGADLAQYGLVYVPLPTSALGMGTGKRYTCDLAAMVAGEHAHAGCVCLQIKAMCWVAARAEMLNRRH